MAKSTEALDLMLLSVKLSLPWQAMVNHPLSPLGPPEPLGACLIRHETMTFVPMSFKLVEDNQDWIAFNRLRRLRVLQPLQQQVALEKKVLKAVPVWCLNRLANPHSRWRQ